MFRGLFTPPTTTQRHLDRAHVDRRHKPELFGALLSGKVYVLDFDIVLTEDGPELEFPVQPGRFGRFVTLYSGRNRLPASRDPMEAEAMPFVTVLRWLPHGVSICVDPDYLDYVISPSETEVLRRIMPGADA